MGLPVLKARHREETGTAAMRRLRREDKVPAVLYGHGRETVNLVLPQADLMHLLEQGAQMLSLAVDGAEEQVLVREIQFDALGDDVIHVDFARVSLEEVIEVDVPLELHGSPSGLKEGGTLEQPLHNIAVRCRAADIPDVIRLEIAHLELRQAVHVSELDLPPGVSATISGETVIVMVHPPKLEVVEEEAEPPEAAGEPEVIGAKESEEAADEEASKE